MKKKTIIAATLCCLLGFASCEKNNEADSPVTILTYTPYFITEESALCGGEVINNKGVNITDFGVCWGEFIKPTLEDNQRSLVHSFTEVDGVKGFTYTIDSLEPKTTYYYRAYVTCGDGQVFYGEPKSFVTSTSGQNAYYRTVTVQGVTFRMVRVNVDSPFYIGAQSTSPSNENYDSESGSSEGPVHEVVLRNDYYIGETEVSIDLWYAITRYNPGHYFGTNTPANGTSWNMITQDFLPKLNQLTRMNFRLPTEAEWEFAARGANQGRHYKYAGSNDYNEVGWCIENSNDAAHPMAQKNPNERGLYDMVGNVAEICQDWIWFYSDETQVDPLGTNMLDDYPYKITRGGNYHIPASHGRNSCRLYVEPDKSYINIGFRLVCDP